MYNIRVISVNEVFTSKCGPAAEAGGAGGRKLARHGARRFPTAALCCVCLG